MEQNLIDDFLSFSHSPLFTELSEEQCKKIYSITSEIILQPGEYLIREEEPANDIYIIMAGDLTVSRRDLIYPYEHILAHVHKGEIVGEIGVLDQGKRTASIKAVTPVRVRKIPFTELVELAQHEKELQSTFHKLSINLAKRVRSILDSTIKTLHSKLEETQKRTVMGRFVIYVVGFTCFYTFFLRIVDYFYKTVFSNSLSTFFLLTFFSIIFTLIIKRSHLSAETFGLNLKNWKRSGAEGFLFTLPVVAVFICLKDFIIYINPAFISIPISPPSLVVLGIIGCFLQEFLVRGGLQAPLNYFLMGERKVIKAIIVSNLIFSMTYLHIGTLIAGFVFISGLYLGWLFSRHNNLIGCTIAHIIFFVGMIYL